MSGNNLDNQSTNYFIANNTITSVVLRDNNIADEGASALALSTSLKNLDLARNKVGLVGVRAFARNSTLRTLNLTENPEIGDEVIRVLWQSLLWPNYNFHTLELPWTVSSTLRKRIEKILERNRYIDALENRRLGISPQDVVDIRNLDPAEVLMALYARADTPRLGALAFQESGSPHTITKETARQWLEEKIEFDYVNGKALKLRFGPILSTDRYNYINGENAAQQVIEELRKTSAPKQEENLLEQQEDKSTHQTTLIVAEQDRLKQERAIQVVAADGAFERNHAYELIT